MTNALRFTVFFSLLVLVAACKKDDTPPTTNANHLPTAEAMMNANIGPGSRKDSMMLSTGFVWNYHLTAPFVTGGQKFPLILALHWASNPSSYEEYATCLVEPSFSNVPAFIFSPENYGFEWTEQFNRERLETFLDLAIEHWPIDTSKIVITGYSLGGTAAWRFAQDYENYFSASIAMAGEYNSGFKTDIPTYLIQGSEDVLFPLALSQSNIDGAIARGSDITVVVADSLGHTEACSYVDYLKGAADWLVDEVW